MTRKIAIFMFIVLSVAFPLCSAASEGDGWALSFEALAGHSLLPDGGIAVAMGNSVTAINNNGIKTWEWHAAEPIRKILADESGAVFAAFGTTLVKLDSEGSLVWSADTMHAVYSLGLLPEGVVAAGYEFGVLAFDEAGKNIWEHYAHEECDT